MQLFNDTVQGGVWCYCRKCGHSSDLFSLLQKALKLNEGSVINWLISNKLIASNTPTERLLIQRRHLFKRLDAIDNLFMSIQDGDASFAHGKPAKLMRSLGLHAPTNFTTEWLRKGPGRLMVFAGQQTVENSLRPPKESEPRFVKPRKISVASPAESMLVVPFYACPGRVCSVTMIHAESNGSWHLNDWHLQATPDSPINGGIAIHHDSMRRTEHDEIVLTDDVMTYLVLHCKNFKTDAMALPIACYRNGTVERTTKWQLLGNKKPVFWCPTLTPQQLWQAIRLDAKISTYGSKYLSIEEFASTKDPRGLVNKCRKLAKHWTELVLSIVTKKDFDVASEWLGQVQLTAEEQERVIDIAPTKQKKILQQIFEQSVQYKTLPFKLGFVESRTAGWFYCKPDGEEQLITNAPFEILEVISNGSGDSIATVQVHIGGKTHTFQCLKSELDKEPFGLIEQQLIEDGVALPAYDRAFARHAVSLAIQFHAPTVRQRQQKVGVTDENKLSLPCFSINLESGRLRSVKTVDQSLPAACITSPKPDPGLLTDLLEDAHSGPVGASTAALAAQIGSHLFGGPKIRVAVTESSSMASHFQLLDAIGAHQLPGKRLKNVLNALETHDWFAGLGFDQPVGPGLVGSVLAQPVNGTLSVPVNWGQACHGLITGSMLVLVHGITTKFPKNQLTNIGSALCGYVQWLVKTERHHEIAASNDIFRLSVKNFRRYLSSLGVNGDKLRVSTSEVLHSTTETDKIAQAAYILHSTGDHQLPEFAGSTPLLVVKKDKTLIHRRKFNQWLRKNSAPELSLVEFDTVFCGVGTKTELRPYQGEQYWWFPREQFTNVCIQRALARTMAKKRAGVA